MPEFNLRDALPFDKLRPVLRNRLNALEASNDWEAEREAMSREMLKYQGEIVPKELHQKYKAHKQWVDDLINITRNGYVKLLKHKFSSGELSSISLPAGREVCFVENWNLCVSGDFNNLVRYGRLHIIASFIICDGGVLTETYSYRHDPALSEEENDLKAYDQFIDLLESGIFRTKENQCFYDGDLVYFESDSWKLRAVTADGPLGPISDLYLLDAHNVEIDCPSGELIVAEDISIEGFKSTLEAAQNGLDMNFSLHRLAYTLGLAEEYNVFSYVAGYSSVDEVDTTPSSICNAFSDEVFGFEYNESLDGLAFDSREVWVTLVDREVLIQFAEKALGDRQRAEEQVSNYVETCRNFQLSIKPGRKHIYFPNPGRGSLDHISFDRLGVESNKSVFVLSGEELTWERKKENEAEDVAKPSF